MHFLHEDFAKWSKIERLDFLKTEILLGITIGRLQDSALTSAWITPPAPRGNENDDGQRRDVRESAC